MRSKISWILVFLEGTGAAQNVRARLASVAAAAGEAAGPLQSTELFQDHFPPSWIQTFVVTQPERWGHLRTAVRVEEKAQPSHPGQHEDEGLRRGTASGSRNPRLTGLHPPSAISPGSYSAPINLPPINYQPLFFGPIRQIWCSNVLGCGRTKLGQGHIEPVPKSTRIPTAHTQPICLSIAPIK